MNSNSSNDSANEQIRNRNPLYINEAQCVATLSAKTGNARPNHRTQPHR